MKKRFLYSLVFTAIMFRAAAFHLPVHQDKTNVDLFFLNIILKIKAPDTSAAVLVTIKDIDSRLPNMDLESEPFLIDALKYGGLFNDNDVEYIRHHIKQTDYPTSLQNNTVALTNATSYLVASFENKWDKLALIWLPKKVNNLSENTAINSGDNRGVFMVLKLNAISFDVTKWRTQQITFNNGFVAVSNPSDPVKVATILSSKETLPSLFGSFFSYMYAWLQNGFKDVNGGSDASSEDGTVRTYFQVFVPAATGPNYVFKRRDGSFFSEMMFTNNDNTDPSFSIKNVINNLVPSTDDVFIYQSTSENRVTYYLLHQDEKDSFAYFGTISNISTDLSKDTVLAHFEFYPTDKYPVDDQLKARLYVVKSDLAKNHKQYDKAFYWLQKAAPLNDPFAMYKLGYAYYNGEGVTIDVAKARYWLERSAASGNEEAQAYLIKTGLKKK